MKPVQLHPALLGALIGVPLLIAALSVGLWVGSADVRAMVRLADAWVNPVETIRPDPRALVVGVRDLARLETASVELEQHIRGQRGTDDTWSLLGERIDFVARGVVTAGVDLGEFDESDLRVDDIGVVWVRLPAAEIWHVELDEEQSFVAMRERGWLGWPDTHFETRVRREAVQSLRSEAEAQGVLPRADQRAHQVISELLLGAGAAEVRFE